MNRFMSTDTRPDVRKLRRRDCIKILKAHGITEFDQTQPAREMQKLIAASKLDLRKGMEWEPVNYEDENGRQQVRAEPIVKEPVRTVDSQSVLENRLAQLSKANDERQKLAEENLNLANELNEMKAQMAELMSMMAEKQAEKPKRTRKPMPVETDPMKMGFAQLKKHAKQIGITAPITTKKDELLKMILEKGNEQNASERS